MGLIPELHDRYRRLCGGSSCHFVSIQLGSNLIQTHQDKCGEPAVLISRPCVHIADSDQMHKIMVLRIRLPGAPDKTKVPCAPVKSTRHGHSRPPSPRHEDVARALRAACSIPQRRIPLTRRFLRRSESQQPLLKPNSNLGQVCKKLAASSCLGS
jgi:hypothetical protein